MDDLTNNFMNKNTLHDEEDSVHSGSSSRDRLEGLIAQVENRNLSHMLHDELRNMVSDHQHIVKMLQQRSEVLEDESTELKQILSESQRRYEKAVREMQFFKKKYDRLIETTSYPPTKDSQTKPNPPSHYNHGLTASHLQNYGHLTPSSSPQPSSVTDSDLATITHSYDMDALGAQKSNYPPSSHYWPVSPPGSVMSDNNVPLNRRRNDSNATAAASIFSSFSASTDATSVYSHDHNKKAHSYNRNPSVVSSHSTSSGMNYSTWSDNNMSMSNSSRQNTATVANNVILQRKTDPLAFGGSDALWDSIAKSQGNDTVIEKLISNFIRRGGSPNTAKQSSSFLGIKYGFGMIHAVIIHKAINALDLLLQNGANPNIMPMCQMEADKLSPCYLASSIGWLAGLEKIVDAGGDLLFSRGEGIKKKTSLHVAAENGHAAVTEYIVNMTQGLLNIETDSQGATPLHYACLSGNTDIVAYLVKACGISPHEPDGKGELPIHWATRKGHIEVVILLVERFSCDINAYVSKKVPSPYDIAKSQGHKRLAEHIKSRGGLNSKKLDKRRAEDLSTQVPGHLEAALAKNGLFSGF